MGLFSCLVPPPLLLTPLHLPQPGPVLERMWVLPAKIASRLRSGRCPFNKAQRLLCTPITTTLICVLPPPSDYYNCLIRVGLPASGISIGFLASIHPAHHCQIKCCPSSPAHRTKSKHLCDLAPDAHPTSWPPLEPLFLSLWSPLCPQHGTRILAVLLMFSLLEMSPPQLLCPNQIPLFI